ncbi:Primosomal protein N' (replication factor Y)-superfamily II helicase [hydrothermal vent metagenome]|uniref:Primosomal protein N' (Replication factor Y)-superfamily II helicase n=1 Tax=hydrothermal vent metagenome TaxID=652676 RepID=A0A1W1B9E7_9ZZZZ
MTFSPKVGELKCNFCDTVDPIENSDREIREYDYYDGLNIEESQPQFSEPKEISCAKCGGSFTTKSHIISSNCPYCSTPTVTECINKITPESLLPFVLTQKEAKERLHKWIGSLWFAPTVFTKYFRGNEELQGLYIPHWSYDSNTYSIYSGERGDTYYVTVRQRVMVNGKEEFRDVQEARINWTPVDGSVSLTFDDVIIGGCETLPRNLIDSISPWNIGGLVHFDQRYLSGFESEEYTTTLGRGFEYAKDEMGKTIRNRIRSDIGGDEQRIHNVNTQYDDILYKNMLFPIWTATFKWKDKSYRYLINAQTGRVAGERPYSIAKIALLIVIILSIVAAAIYYDQNRG